MKNIVSGIFFLICLGLVISPVWGKVTVTRDKYGIPSIQADTEEELFEACGYEVAVDRLWQMETNRRMAWGTLAEILGPKLVPMDMQTRMMGYTEEEYQALFEKIPVDLKKLISAYIRGINRRVDEVTKDPRLQPIEFLALKLKPKPYREIDSLSFLTALYRIFGVRGGGEFKNLFTLQTLTKRFGKSDGWGIFNDWTWINDPAAPTYTSRKVRGDYITDPAVLDALPSHLQDTADVAKLVPTAERQYSIALNEARRINAPVMPGSYAWTLSPKVTGTGYPILVGNVQAQHGSVPSIIHEIQLKGGRFNVVGASIPLLPYIFVGHTHHMAWSIMVGMVDNIDIYQEVLNPVNREEYLFRGGWRKMEKRTEKIRIAGGKIKEVTIYRTVHGPVFSPFPFDPNKADINRVYTKKLAWWKTANLLAESLLTISLAENVKEFGKAMSLHTPTVHYVYADIEGNIAYWHNGLNPERANGFDPRFPLPGTGEAEWTGRYLPNAHVINPSEGYVTGWNNKASPDARNPIDKNSNHYYGKFNRVLWLHKALAGRNDLDRAANEDIMRYIGGVGVYSSIDNNGIGYSAIWLVQFLSQAVDKVKGEEKQIFKQVLEILTTWDGRSVVDAENDEKFQAGQTIYLDWLIRLLKATLGDELEGIDDFKKTHCRLTNMLFRSLEGPMTTLPVSRDYFDNINTNQKETVEDIFIQSLSETVAHMKKTFNSSDPEKWKAPRSKIVYKHAMFGKLAEMWDNNVGTYPMIVELRPEGAIGFSRFHLGESGNISAGADKKPVFDPHFFDMQPLFKSYTHQKMGLD